MRRLCEQHALESAFLEFKSSPTIDHQDTKKIAEVVCAFANAGGGQVLFGVQESSDGRAEALDEGWMPSQRKNTWLSDVILAHVTPKVDFEIVTTPLASSRELYVVNVHQGYSAHQASDRKFYRRREAKCIPMDWFEIEDVRNRKARPVLEVQIEVIPNNADIMPMSRPAAPYPLQSISLLLTRVPRWWNISNCMYGSMKGFTGTQRRGL
ncbi:MAG: helix-turn-helix domain-containing protein [Dethiobacter sp.]